MDLSERNARVIEEFRANGGTVGGPWEGATMLLLHTKGAKTGQPRVDPLVYLPDGERYVVIASKGGAPEDPHWYRNLLADSNVEIRGRHAQAPGPRHRDHRPRARRALRPPGRAASRVRRVRGASDTHDPGHRAQA